LFLFTLVFLYIPYFEDYYVFDSAICDQINLQIFFNLFFSDIIKANIFGG